nr:MAG TPA: hypothetical protein [Caudoviricetes sp.]
MRRRSESGNIQNFDSLALVLHFSNFYTTNFLSSIF